MYRAGWSARSAGSRRDFRRASCPLREAERRVSHTGLEAVATIGLFAHDSIGRDWHRADRRSWRWNRAGRSRPAHRFRTGSCGGGPAIATGPVARSRRRVQPDGEIVSAKSSDPRLFAQFARISPAAAPLISRWPTPVTWRGGGPGSHDSDDLPPSPTRNRPPQSAAATDSTRRSAAASRSWPGSLLTCASTRHPQSYGGRVDVYKASHRPPERTLSPASGIGRATGIAPVPAVEHLPSTAPRLPMKHPSPKKPASGDPCPRDYREPASIFRRYERAIEGLREDRLASPSARPGMLRVAVADPKPL